MTSYLRFAISRTCSLRRAGNWGLPIVSQWSKEETHGLHPETWRLRIQPADNGRRAIAFHTDQIRKYCGQLMSSRLYNYNIIASTDEAAKIKPLMFMKAAKRRPQELYVHSVEFREHAGTLQADGIYQCLLLDWRDHSVCTMVDRLRPRFYALRDRLPKGCF